MVDRVRNQRRQQNRFNYLSQFNTSDQPPINLHHRYFKLYEQFSAQSQDAFYFNDHENSKANASYRINQFSLDQIGKDKLVGKESQYQNQILKKQLRQHQQTIKVLKSELSYCKNQLNQVTKINKIEFYDQQNTIKALQEEIQIILERNKSSQAEIRKLKDIIRDMNQYQIKSTYQLSQVRLYNRSKSLGKPPSASNYCLNYSNMHKEIKNDNSFGQNQTNNKLIGGLKQMYEKIMNFKVVSLKQLWRWLKEMGQMLHRLRKWSKSCRAQLKQSKNITYQRLIDLLNDVMILIN